jgi:hypothetical protein
VHCRPGGVLVLVPDHTRQTFRPSTDHGGTDGRAVRYLQWSWDPDPADTTIRTDYAFVLREPDGETRVVQETHLTGLFDREVWLRLIAEAGFEATAATEITTGDWVPRELFIGHRPR